MNSQIHFLNVKQKDLAPKEKTPKQNLLHQVKGIFLERKIKKKIDSQFIYKIGYTISDQNASIQGGIEP